jgi:hypothetical protein
MGSRLPLTQNRQNLSRLLMPLLDITDTGSTRVNSNRVLTKDMA